MQRVRIFISYAHEDEALLKELEAHLAGLRREGLIEAWHDRRIPPGGVRREAIDAELGRADVVLLLVSPEFLASDYCYEVELAEALRRQAEGMAWVIPLVVRPVDWESLPLAGLQALPRDARPVTSYPSRDEGWVAVVKGLRQALATGRPETGERAVAEQVGGVLASAAAARSARTVMGQVKASGPVIQAVGGGNVQVHVAAPGRSGWWGVVVGGLLVVLGMVVAAWLLGASGRAGHKEPGARAVPAVRSAEVGSVGSDSAQVEQVLAGVVQDQAGQPVEGAMVSVAGHVGVEATTDRNGSFRLTVLDKNEAKVLVAVRKAGYRPYPYEIRAMLGNDQLAVALTRSR